jgi:hypothetical protein
MNQKMELLPQMDMYQSDGIADLLYRSKLRIEKPGACAREYNSIMQIIMESLIGWNFDLRKQSSSNACRVNVAEEAYFDRLSLVS